MCRRPLSYAFVQPLVLFIQLFHSQAKTLVLRNYRLNTFRSKSFLGPLVFHHRFQLHHHSFEPKANHLYVLLMLGYLWMKRFQIQVLSWQHLFLNLYFSISHLLVFSAVFCFSITHSLFVKCIHFVIFVKVLSFLLHF